MERHSFRTVSGDSPKTLWKPCLSTTFPHQETCWNYRIFSIAYSVVLTKTISSSFCRAFQIISRWSYLSPFQCSAEDLQYIYSPNIATTYYRLHEKISAIYWLRGVQSYLYSVFNICTLWLNKKKNTTFEFRSGKIEMYSLKTN